MFLISDPYMDLVYSILFISGITSVLVMELCVLCLNNYTGSQNRSSPLSLSIITAFIVQMILDLVSISLTFYKQLLCTQIPQAQKRLTT